MRKLLLLFLLFSTAFSFSQEEKEKKHSVGVFLSPVELTFWGGLPYNDAGHAKRLYGNPAAPIGIIYGYKITNYVSVSAGLTYDTEYFSYNFLHTSHIQKSIDYRMSYIRVPLSARVFTSNFLDENKKSGFFLELQAIVDFVEKEDVWVQTSTFYYDHHFSAPPGGYSIPPPTTTETHSGQIKFNRICPLLFIGKEFEWEQMNFYFGVKLEFPAVYQSGNTQEIYRNVKLSPMNIGLSYRF
jgi:hypothetical protein